MLSLKLLILFASAGPIPSYFYPFGDDVGDSVVPSVKDGSSPAVFLDQPFIFFGREERILYVRKKFRFTQCLWWHATTSPANL